MNIWGSLLENFYDTPVGFVIWSWRQFSRKCPNFPKGA